MRGFCLSWHPGGKAWLQGNSAAGIAYVVRKQQERNTGALFAFSSPLSFSTRPPAYEVAQHTFRLHLPTSVKPLGEIQVCLLGNSKSTQVVEDQLLRKEIPGSCPVPFHLSPYFPHPGGHPECSLPRQLLPVSLASAAYTWRLCP